MGSLGATDLDSSGTVLPLGLVDILAILCMICVSATFFWFAIRGNVPGQGDSLGFIMRFVCLFLGLFMLWLTLEQWL